MATISDFATLKAAVAEWLWRTGDSALVARADTFVQLFEAEFVGDPENRFTDMEEIDAALITGAAMPLPDGYLEMRALKVLGAAIGVADQPLDYITPARAAILDASQLSTSQAKNYTIRANQIFLTPQSMAPLGASLELSYYKFTGLSDDAPTNWLMSGYPNIYLYGALEQAAIYIDDKSSAAAYLSKRMMAQTKLPVADRKRKVGAGPLKLTPSTGFRT